MNVNKHGRQIRVVEDLNGNFADKSYIFVWGQSSTSFCNNENRPLDMRIDDITQYLENDTLIMFVKKAHKRYNKDIERTDDYVTLGCYPSVLKLSNGYVTGYINNWGEAVS